MEGGLAVAVVGPGRAGRARIAALEGHPGARLAAVVASGEEPGLEQVLADPSVQAVIVATPSALHPGQVRAALLAGKHVAVEFPLAASASAAAGLFELARAQGRVLHVEHIELLSPAQRAQRERAALLGRPRGGALQFRATSDGWIGDRELAGSEPLRALPRLHRLLDLFGSAAPQSSSLERLGNSGYRLSVELEFNHGGRARLLETRTPRGERATRWAIECEHGVLDDPAAAAPAGLFRDDLDVFVARVEGRAQSYVSEQRILEALSLVEAIEQQLGSDSKS